VKKPPTGGLSRNAASAYCLTASLAIGAASLAAPTAADAAPEAAPEVMVMTADAADAAGSTAEAVAAGAFAAGAGQTASSFLPQAANARAATREARSTDVFIAILNPNFER
jgi:hypothetical protein